jgi:hypothetical protein
VASITIVYSTTLGEGMYFRYDTIFVYAEFPLNGREDAGVGGRVDRGR